MELILKYFPQLSQLQRERMAMLYPLYMEWNSRINVISRKDTDQLYLRHVLHSLAIARVCEFEPGARILDVGCGGGFPGIPLAIMFPEASFTLADSIGKKIKVVEAVKSSLNLSNVNPQNKRAEQIEGRFDYVISRAVTTMDAFIPWVWSKIERGKHGTLNNGILYLKGGDLKQEMDNAGKPYKLFPIDNFFEEEFFDTKSVVYVPR